MTRFETRQSSWTKYSWKWARLRICILLQVDRELLHLPEQEAGQRRPGVRRCPRQVGEQVAEGERPGRRRRLHDVQTLPSQIRPELERVASLQPGERIGNLRHARAEVGRRVRRRSELLIAARSGTSAACSGNSPSRGCRADPALADGVLASSAADAADRAPRVADAQLVQQSIRERPLVAGRERPGRRVLRSERAGRHAAALRQRRRPE